MRIAIAAALLGLTFQAAGLQPYTDRGRRFSFSYPSSWGATSPGTNDGFQDRVAAVRFARFPARFAAEAVLTRGFPLIDLQAAGGLYDALTLEIFPEPLRGLVVRQLPPLTAGTLCEALGRSRHIDPSVPDLRSLSPAQLQAVGQTDTMRNANPRMVDCQVHGNTVVFDKERSFREGDPVQHVYGAVRFLPPPYSTFQLIAGGEAPESSAIAAMAEVVNSFKSE